MKRIFIKNLILLQGLNLVIKPLWLLVIDRMAQNLLGTEVYGEYYLILNLTLIFNIILDLGIQNFNNTSIAADNSFFKRNFSSVFFLKSFLSTIYISLIIVIGLRSDMSSELLFILTANQILNSFNLYLRTNINGMHRYATDSLLSVSDKFFAILFCLFFYYADLITIRNFALAQLLASAVTFILAFGINIKLWRQSHAVSDGKDKLSRLLVSSMPYALLFTLMNFYTRMDVSMMNWLLNDAVYQAGIYAHSFRLLDAAAMFAMLFAGLLLPMFAKQISEGSDLRPLAGLASSMLLMISISTAVASFCYSEELLSSLYKYDDHEHLQYSASVFRLIMLTFVPMSITFVYSTLLTSAKDIRHMNIYALTAFLFNFVLNFLLIPEYKAFGAAIGSLITQSVFALLCVLRCFKLFPFSIPYKETLRFLLFTIMLSGLYFLLKHFGNLWIELSVFAVSALILSFLLKIFDISGILRYFDKRVQ